MIIAPSEITTACSHTTFVQGVVLMPKSSSDTVYVCQDSLYVSLSVSLSLVSLSIYLPLPFHSVTGPRVTRSNWIPLSFHSVRGPM